MNQIERKFQVEMAEWIIGTANREVSALRKSQEYGEKALLDESLTPAIRAGIAYEMDVRAKRIDVAEGRRLQAYQRIAELDQEAARQAEVKVVTWSGTNRAQIAIHYYRDDGKKMSYTRHVRREGANWVGASTISTNRVTYRLPGTALAEAA
jgi:hypothetical protein